MMLTALIAIITVMRYESPLRLQHEQHTLERELLDLDLVGFEAEPPAAADQVRLERFSTVWNGSGESAPGLNCF